MKKATRSLLLALAASAMLLPVSASLKEGGYERRSVHMRAGVLADTSVVASTNSPTTPPTSAQAATSAAATSSAPATSATSTTAPTGGSSSSAAVQSTATKGASSATPAATTQPVMSSAVATTDASGQVVTSFVEFTPTPSSLAPSQTNTSTSSSSDDGGGLGTGSIVGLSVAGGIAAIAIILFFVWKFTRKRFADFDDNEAIKWPELNAHNNDVHALPTNATGRGGFGPANDSDINLTRPPSPGAYANSITTSVPEGYGAGDPYAVPPLPHLNPNQPYHDEPGAYGQPAGFYDPYRGPVPNTFGDTVSSDGLGAESIPMTQMARMHSPSPQVYDMQGRGSPAPQAAMGYPGLEERSRTPTSVAVSAGRASPGPNSGYGYGPR